MSWAEIVELIVEEAGDKISRRIEERIRREHGGLRVTISKRPIITMEMIEKVAPGKPSDAARKLGVSRATVYRRIQHARLIR